METGNLANFMSMPDVPETLYSARDDLLVILTAATNSPEFAQAEERLVEFSRLARYNLSADDQDTFMQMLSGAMTAVAVRVLFSE